MRWPSPNAPTREPGPAVNIAGLVRGWAVALLAVVLVVPAVAAPTAAAPSAATGSTKMAAPAVEGFRDVPGDHQFYRAISWMSGERITNGHADNSFRPRDQVSREAFAAFLYRLAGRPTVALPSSSPFKDVGTGDQFFREIVWLSQQNITTGWSDGTFRPKQDIHRDAMAAFLYRYEGRPGFTPPTSSPFKDVPRSAQFYKEVTWLAAQGISTGWTSDNTFRPYIGTSREATAAFLFRAFAPSNYRAPAYTPPETWDPSRDVTRLLSDPESVLVVVNKRRPLSPQNYVPQDLVSLRGLPGGSEHRLRSEAADQLRAMYRAASADGASFGVTSSYRSRSYQSGLFSNYVRRHGTANAELFSARPGYSEHQTGWAVDLFSEGHRLTASFGNTRAGRWVAEHGHKYGFIVRYPQGKTSITGYKYEPWHLRYVGVELATHMHERRVTTLEEQFGLPRAPSYP